MKKLLTMGLTLALTLGLASVSLAGTVSVDFLQGGEVDWDEPGVKNNDLSQVAVGFEMPFREFKFGCNLTSGTIEDYRVTDGRKYDFDTASFLIKGGYALVNNNNLRLDLTGGFYDRVTDWNEKVTGTKVAFMENEYYYSLTLGVDAKIKFSKRAWLDLSYAFGIDPKCEEESHYDAYDADYDEREDSRKDRTYDLDYLGLFNCKFNALFTRNFGGSVGYSSELVEDDNHTISYSGFTTGIFFKF